MKKMILGVLSVGLLLQAARAELTWQTDLPKAEAEAKAKKNLVLLDFTGSDWCGWCIKMDRETFSQPAFENYAARNLVLVKLDFPHKKKLPAELKRANEELQAKYDVHGFPTLVALKPDGTVVWKQVGYLAGGPPAVITKLEEARKK
jgi:thioredoxin-related protein